MIKEMTLKDKAKLLFADSNHKYETKGEKRLLTPEEEEAIVEDCHKKHQIGELNELVMLSNLTTFAIADVHINMLNFELVMSRINTWVTIIALKGRSNDTIDKILAAVDGEKSKDARYFAKKIEEEREDVEDSFSLFCMPGSKYKGQKETLVAEPNLLIQKMFVRAIDAYKRLKATLYVVDYISEKGGMNFVCKIDQEIIDEANKLLGGFFTLEEGFLGILYVYRESLKVDLIKKKNFTEPRFFELLTDQEKVLQLTDEERGKAEEKVDKHIERGAYPTT
jgi:hypothetical protein